MTMGVRQTRTMLWVAGSTMSALGAAAIVAAVLLPLELPSADLSHVATSKVERKSQQLPALDAIVATLDLPLQRPLRPSTPRSTAASAVPLPVKLTGTIVEPGQSLAVLVTADGRSGIYGVGERVGDVLVVSVEQDRASVTFNGTTTVLKVEGRAPGG